MKHDKKIQNKGIKTISLLNYAFSSSSILLFSLLLLLFLLLLNSIAFPPPPPQFYCFPSSSIQCF